MRIVVAAVALAPFVLVLLGMATGRAHVQPCCQPTALDGHRGSAPEGARQANATGSPLTSTSTYASGSVQ